MTEISAAMAASTPTPKPVGYGLVRDKNGKPRIDGDPRDLHPQILAMMTQEEFDVACEEYDNAA